jgi:hypothetical protein
MNLDQLKQRIELQYLTTQPVAKGRPRCVYSKCWHGQHSLDVAMDHANTDEGYDVPQLSGAEILEIFRPYAKDEAKFATYDEQMMQRFYHAWCRIYLEGADEPDVPDIVL